MDREMLGWWVGGRKYGGGAPGRPRRNEARLATPRSLRDRRALAGNEFLVHRFA